MNVQAALALCGAALVSGMALGFPPAPAAPPTAPSSQPGVKVEIPGAGVKVEVGTPGTPGVKVQAPGVDVQAGDAPGKRKDPARFEKEIAKMEADAEKNPPPKDSVLFIGSSSIRLWKLSDSFPTRTVLNRGFGGSVLADSVHYAPRLVWPHSPKVVVVYAGDNDIGGGLTPMEVSADFAALVAKIREKLPQTPIVYLSIKPSIKRWALWGKVQEANAKIKAVCDSGEKLTFVDVGPSMLGEDGKPNPELFVKDGLHMTPAGYAVWTKLLDPVLDRLLTTTTISK